MTLMEEIMSAGGWTAQEFDFGNSVRGDAFRWLPSMNYGAIGYSGPVGAQPIGNAGEGNEPYYANGGWMSPKLRQFLETGGFRPAFNPNGGQYQYGIADPGGGVVPGTEITSASDSDFMTQAALLMGGGYFGGNLLSQLAAGGSLPWMGSSSIAAGAPTSITQAGIGPGISMGAPISLEGGIAAAAPGSVTAASIGGGTAGAGAFGSWSDVLKGLATPSGARGLLDIAGGLYGMKLASDARKASDPFAQYRAGYGQQLQALEANPASITSRPGWDAGILAIQRGAASSGYAGSGNMMQSLRRFGSDFYTQELQRLAGLAGAWQTPGAGQMSSADLASRSLASMGYGLGRIILPGQGG